MIDSDRSVTTRLPAGARKGIGDDRGSSSAGFARATPGEVRKGGVPPSESNEEMRRLSTRH